MMVVLGFGWAKPVPVNMKNFKKERQYMAITALAGPASNILLAIVVFFIYGLIIRGFSGSRASGAGDIFLKIVSRTATLSVALAVFNIVPIPPLDGSKILFSFLPEHLYHKLMRYERFGMGLIILFVWSSLFDITVGRATFAVRDWFIGISQFAYDLVG